MKRFDEMGDAELAAALRSLRPEPSPAFTVELDQRAAAGFPRRSPQGARNPFARFLAWLRSGTKFRFLIPAGGVAIALIAVATVVVANTGSSSDSSSGGQLLSLTEEAAGGASADEMTSGAAGATEQNGSAMKAAPSTGAAEESATAGESGSFEAEAVPDVEVGGSVHQAGGGAAADTAHRDVERASEIVIGTKPGDVGERRRRCSKPSTTTTGSCSIRQPRTAAALRPKPTSNC